MGKVENLAAVGGREAGSVRREAVREEGGGREEGWKRREQGTEEGRRTREGRGSQPDETVPYKNYGRVSLTYTLQLVCHVE